MRVASRGFRVTLPQELSDDRLPLASASANAGVGMAHVMDADVSTASICGNQVPRPLEVGTRLIVRIAGDHEVTDPIRQTFEFDLITRW